MTRAAIERELLLRERASDARRRRAVRGLRASADRAAYAALSRHPLLGLGASALVGAALGRFAPRPHGLPRGLLGAGVHLGTGLATRLASGGIL